MSLNSISEGTIPETIRIIEQWICWREDERDGKPTKVPIKPYRTSGTPFASATDPGTWRDFETALTYHRESNSRTDGVGFVFDPEAGIVGVDLDNCRDADSETIEKWAADIVDRLDSYTEISPSGTGIHVLIQGELPPGRNRRGDVEIYDRDRFFTVTGAHLVETPQEVARRQDALLAIHHEFVQTSGDNETAMLTEATERAASNGASRDGGDDEALVDGSAPVQPVGPNSGLRRKFGRDQPVVDDPALEAALHGLPPGDIPDPVPRTLDEVAGPGVDLSDSELLRRATASKSGETIQALLDGENSLWSEPKSRYPSQSEADMGLCFYLAFWTGGDPERMDRLFRDSELYREKWDRRHYGNGATYGKVCIARTLLKLDDYYSPPGADSEDDDGANQWATSGGSTRRADPFPSTHGTGQSRSTERSTDGSTSPIDIGAVEDAQRLATKVKRQQEQLDAYKERIVDLETRLRWYRIAFDLQSGDSPLPGNDGPPDFGIATHDIDPRGEPAAPPRGDLDGEEQRTSNRDSIKPTAEAPGPPETAHEKEDSPTEDESESRLRQWLRHRWS
jgi:putative DNA primase/helicase